MLGITLLGKAGAVQSPANTELLISARSDYFTLSGLIVLENPANTAGLPTDGEVWALANRMDQKPLDIIDEDEDEDDDDDDGYGAGDRDRARLPPPHRAYERWLECSRASGVISRRNTFLISLTAPVEGVGWARVRLTETTLIGRLAGIEFVTLSEDGLRFSGLVSPEDLPPGLDDETWVVVGAAR